MTVLIDAQPSVLETAASLLRTFADRAPSSDRQGLHGIAERFEDALAQLEAYEATASSRSEFPSVE
jgi:HPt (histidine-containing phosphotransfer) domain-containing protein